MAWVNLISLWVGMWTLAMAVWHGERLHWRKRVACDWGEEHGERFEYREVRNKHHVLCSIVMSFPVSARFCFRLRPETWYDRLSKRLRLAHEPQLGDAEFDARLYIDTDDSDMLQTWRDNESLRVHLKSLLKRIHAQSATLCGLVCEDGKLHVHLAVPRVASVDRLRGETVVWLLPLLTSLRDESILEGLASADRQARQRPKRGVDLPRLICFGLFLSGTCYGFWYMQFAVEPLLDVWALFKLSILCAAIIFPILLGWAMARTGAQTGRHRRFLEWLFMGTLGLMFTGFFVVRLVNQHLDFGEPQRIAVTEMMIVEHRAHRGGIKHSFRCRSESGQLGRYRTIPISATKYRVLKTAWGGNERASGMVRLHPGALGYPWAEPWY